MIHWSIDSFSCSVNIHWDNTQTTLGYFPISACYTEFRIRNKENLESFSQIFNK